MKYDKNINKSFKKQKKNRIDKRKERQMRKKSYNKRECTVNQSTKGHNRVSNNEYSYYEKSRNNYENNTEIDAHYDSTGTVNNSIQYEELHHEINAFVSSVIPKRDDMIKRDRTIELLTGIIQSRFPKWTVKLFGSYTQGTQTYQSDLDFVITKDSKAIISDNDQLQLIFQLLQRNKFGFNMRYIRARVPIIKVICQSTRISVDISVNKENGSQATEVIQKQLKDEPGLRKIIIFLKHLLRSEGLNDASVGGMSSFVLFSLIFYFYQHIKKAQSDPVFIETNSTPQSSEQFDTDDEDIDKQKEEGAKIIGDEKAKSLSKNNSLNLGKFLFGFLKFYGYKFDDENCGISLINGGEHFYKYEHTHIIEHGSLCIENFQDCQIDIGRSCYHYNMIKHFFQRTLKRLQYAQKTEMNSYLKSIHLFDSEVR